jgi:hypothetical protein
MKKGEHEIRPHEMHVSLEEFRRLFNESMPEGFPRASLEQLNRFRGEHASLFKDGSLWSPDLHRKRIIDWLPRNLAPKVFAST